MECARERNDNKTLREDERDRLIERIVEQKRMATARVRDGFHHVDRGQVIAGRKRKGFTEHGLRSNERGVAFRLFVRGCRRAKWLRGGNSKAVMSELGPNKVLGLDAPYIEGNRVMISLIRIDLDMTFPSTGHAIRALEQVVADGDLPCLPHILVGDVGRARIRSIEVDGREVETIHEAALMRPHAWIVLPPGSAVNAGPNGRAGPRNMLAGVSRGICKAVLHLGADPLASPFLVRGKNPLSPFLWSEALNNESFPTLSEWADWVDSRIPAETLSRMAAEKRSGTDARSSNTAFTTVQSIAYDILRGLHVAGDPAYVAATQPAVDADALEEILRARVPVESMDRDPSWSATSAERILETVVTYAASRWDPAKADKSAVSRGAMRHEVVGMGTKTAQSAAGKRSGAIKADRSLDALVAAYRDVVEKGMKPTQGAVAAAAGVTRQTASRRWVEVVEGV